MGRRVAWGCGALGALVLFMGGSSTAAAQEDAARDEARGIAAEATEEYNLGHFEAALQGFERAFEVFPAPQLLFNIGQCHRELGNHERVVFFFERFLEENPDAPNRDTVSELLAESRAVLEREEAARLAEEQRLAEERAAAVREAEQARLLREAEREEAATPAWEEWWFWTIISVVVVGAGLGIGLGVGLNQEPQLPMGSLGTLDAR